MSSDETAQRVRAALEQSQFSARGAVVTDLDGTAVHQVRTRVLIVDSVQHALERIRDSGRPVLINTLRFPLSVMRTFGVQWAEWTRHPLPCITLNGSLIGDLVQSDGGDLAFDERAAFPLKPDEVDEVLDGLERALDAGVDRFTLFVYPRDWQQGELIWTPLAERIGELSAKYVSASEVNADPISALKERLAAQDICMIAVQIEDPSDPRLAFQHASASSFVTTEGVNKRSGAQHLMGLLGADMAASIGAGDTELDTFLDGIGLSLHVGSFDLPYRGVHDTLKLASPHALGDVLFQVAEHCERTVP